MAAFRCRSALHHIVGVMPAIGLFGGSRSGNLPGPPAQRRLGPARLGVAAGIVALLGSLLPGPVVLAADTTPPTVTTPVLAPNPAVPGATVTVSATATDDVAVASAQLSIDGGAWTAMSPADGAFGGTSEGLSGTVGGSQISQVALGYLHACALTTAGGVMCWGSNGYGDLGNGTSVDSFVPDDVVGLSSGVTAISAGDYITCAITSGGGAKCWGNNAGGQLGDGTTTSSSVPVDVVGLTSGVAAIAVGGTHTCALTNAGGAKCWGFNGNGELGDGSTTSSLTPVDVFGLTSGVAAIAAGNTYSCALTTAGGVKCWGYNGAGNLGNGTFTNNSTPVNVSGLTSGVAAITTGSGSNHTCALTAVGGVKCWGGNGGALGNGTTANSPIPVDVTGLASGQAAVVADGAHSCALGPGAGVKCWGVNVDGELGDGTTTTRTTPVDVSGLTSGGVGIATGWYSSCATTTAGGVKCWGANLYGELGDGTTTNSLTPVDVVGLGGLATGDHTVCVRATDSSGHTSDGTACAILGVGAAPVLPFGTATRTTLIDPCYDVFWGTTYCDPPITRDIVRGDRGQTESTSWLFDEYAGYTVSRGTVTSDGLTAGAMAEAVERGTTTGRGVAFRSFVNNTSTTQTFKVNAVLSGSIDHDFADSDLWAGGAIYVFDAAMFEAALEASGTRAGTFLLGDTSPVSLGLWPTPDYAFANLESLFPGALLGEGRTGQPAFDGPVVLPVTTDFIAVGPQQVFTVMFDVYTRADSKLLGDTLGAGWADFIDTLAPAPNLFTDVDGNPVSGIVALGPSQLPPPLPATLTLAPPTGNDTLGAAHTVTATARAADATPIEGAIVKFKVIAGPDDGLAAPGVTDANGEATFTYTDTIGAGTDTIEADLGGLTSNTVEETWQGSSTTLTYGGAIAGESNDPATMQATLLDQSLAPVSGASVGFTFNGIEACTATTDSSGVASCPLTPSESAGNYTVEVRFAGMAAYLPSATSSPFSVTPEETALAFNGPAFVANGGGLMFSATLTDPADVAEGEAAATPIAGKTVTFTLGTGLGAQTCSRPTNASGVATCTIATVSQPLGSSPVSASYAGDGYDAPAGPVSAEHDDLWYLTRGTFIVGDRSAIVGDTVTWWGPKWSSANSLSGGYRAIRVQGLRGDALEHPADRREGRGAPWAVRARLRR